MSSRMGSDEMLRKSLGVNFMGEFCLAVSYNLFPIFNSPRLWVGRLNNFFQGEWFPTRNYTTSQFQVTSSVVGWIWYHY